MFFPEAKFKLWLCTTATDMRKSFPGLSALVKNYLKENPLSGDCFVFLNRRRTQMKILYFDRSGYCLWVKKLESGVFQLPAHNDVKVTLDWTQLKLILEGIDMKSIRQKKRYSRENHGLNPYNRSHDCTHQRPPSTRKFDDN